MTKKVIITNIKIYLNFLTENREMKVLEFQLCDVNCMSINGITNFLIIMPRRATITHISEILFCDLKNIDYDNIPFSH